ncbi:endo-arabinase [Mucilaginibacter gotjawali]|uniref:Uncharacterized protein n=2 Tax=Mucilaginibacter gotjawali TaxID=1550579 RepID=A0A110B0H3_9SPHI|nr:endo-arabinase [Mucilaginibacter gotjawali]MBB3057900.1 hypothetical protein [Mucilaginibacter gotjawali]BAU52328.1 hypothetical protein MgSA37_00483 [Mucilaginibacter gotjawali]
MKLTVFTVIGLLIALTGYSQSIPDTTAIKQLLEKESTTFRNGDVKGHAECWKIQPYSRIVISTTDGKIIEVPPAIMINPPASMMGGGGTFTNSNYKISVMGNSAWLSHEEESVSKEGKKTYSIEFKMLEKINGDWKIVGMSIHAFNKQ